MGIVACQLHLSSISNRISSLYLQNKASAVASSLCKNRAQKSQAFPRTATTPDPEQKATAKARARVGKKKKVPPNKKHHTPKVLPKSRDEPDREASTWDWTHIGRAHLSHERTSERTKFPSQTDPPGLCFSAAEV